MPQARPSIWTPTLRARGSAKGRRKGCQVATASTSYSRCGAHIPRGLTFCGYLGKKEGPQRAAGHRQARALRPQQFRHGAWPVANLLGAEQQARNSEAARVRVRK